MEHRTNGIEPRPGERAATMKHTNQTRLYSHEGPSTEENFFRQRERTWERQEATENLAAPNIMDICLDIGVHSCICACIRLSVSACLSVCQCLCWEKQSKKNRREEEGAQAVGTWRYNQQVLGVRKGRSQKERTERKRRRQLVGSHM